jgi:hypothetical protein
LVSIFGSYAAVGAEERAKTRPGFTYVFRWSAEAVLAGARYPEIKGGYSMTVHTLKRFSLIVDFIEPDPEEDTPDERARVLGERDNTIRAAAERVSALLTSDGQITTLLSSHGIQFQIVLSH